MAKDKYALTTLSKANKDLALLIDEDLQKESELLQKLIKEVYDANQLVKDSHTKRVQETTDRLNALNKDIEALKKDIDEKDHSITIEQFNHLLKSRDDIFDALNTVRLFNHEFFQNHPIKKQLTMIKTGFSEILKSHQSATTTFPMLEAIKPLATSYLEALDQKTNDYFQDHFLKDKSYLSILDAEEIDTHMNDLLQQYKATFNHFLKNQAHFFSTSLDDQHIDDKLQSLYENTVGAVEKEIESAKAAFEEAFQALEDELKQLEEDTLKALKAQHKKRLDEEKAQRDSLQDDLKQLRFDIMSAEKRGDQKTLDQLLETYDKKQNQNLSLFEEKVKKMAQVKTRAKRKQLIRSQRDLELKHQDELYKLMLQLEIDKLKFSESKSLFKMREDQKAMEHDQKQLTVLKQNLKKAHQGFTNYQKYILKFVDAVENLWIVQTSKHVKHYLESIEFIDRLESTLKTIELKLMKTLQLKTLQTRRFKENLDHNLKSIALDLVFQNEMRSLLKKKTERENLGKVEHIRAQEDIKNDLIYQHALIEIAEKEHELQLLKIKSLYDNEINLTKSQTERLNVGIGVNETMVKTTVESQILFAKQQIKFAEKEYHVRLENIDYALSQELEYAQDKLRAAEQTYLFDKNTRIKERDAKLEDIAYRLALFTEQKDRKRLKDQEEQIKKEYQTIIDAIDKAKLEDANIKRYQKQIDAANARAEKARGDALELKNRTIETFENLLKQSEIKLEEFNAQKSKNLLPYIENEAAKTATIRYEEALKDAKDLLNEKIQEPKVTIAALEKQLSKLEKVASVDLSEYTTQQQALKEKHQTALLALRSSLKDKLDAIDQDEQVFIDKFEKSLPKEKQESELIKNQKLYKATILNKLKTQEQVNTVKQKQRYQTLEADKQSDLKTIENSITEMQKNLEETITSYQRYLKSATRSQQGKLREIKKARREQHRTHRKAIIRKY